MWYVQKPTPVCLASACKPFRPKMENIIGFNPKIGDGEKKDKPTTQRLLWVKQKVKSTIIFNNETIYLVWLDFPWTFSTWLFKYSYFPPQMSHFLHVWSENTWPFRACALQNTALHWSHGFADLFWSCLLRFCFVENSFLQWEHWKSCFRWFAFTWADRALLEQKLSSHSS